MGDELINVNGKRLRGLKIDEAVSTLKLATKELDIVVARDVQAVVEDDPKTKSSNFEQTKEKSSNFEHSVQQQSGNNIRSSHNNNNNRSTSSVFDYPSSNYERIGPHPSTDDPTGYDGSLFSEQRVREEHRRIAQKLHNIGSSSSLCDYRVRASNPKPFVSRTYIGGAATGSSLAMKIHRKNLQSRPDLGSMAPSLHHSCGSLSSLHETRLR